ncbi:DUF2254 domain-containing protein [Salinisphaera sp.]|uniref:DUF2254 domain-containing protein n=1 Tax=Salinisphaera sp. TaxID=1914330 RepID=UPI002D7772F9|nr:DUF2254 domain-containing protein [Salinisphaera sp.]HET7314185.1 DUF2254 domain-containing protein [Salinisphaera sp.]
MAKLIKLWNDLRSSFWFLPTIMSIGAALLSLGLTRADIALGAGWMHDLPWIFKIQASGARGLLSAVAGSMIGVAGVTFSITIAALAYTTSTLGPRLLTNFMDDPGNQFTLGTFLSTFVYCLLLLRTIQSGDEPGGVFIPYLALSFAMVMAFASIAVLIYFIHHITVSLHVSHVVADVARDLDAALEKDQQYSRIASDQPLAYLPADFTETAVAVRAKRDGYIQNLGYGGLVRQAVDHDLVLRLELGPGDFVGEGQTLLWAWPPARLDDGVIGGLHDAYALGPQRTKSQDIRFLVNELVEIAARALSPAMNDPYTAMGCLDWLCAALNRLARSDIVSMHHFDSDGVLRLWASAFNFESLALAIFDQLRPYFAADRNAAEHMLDCIGQVGEFARRADQRRLMRDFADALSEAAVAAMPSGRDRRAIEYAHRRAQHLLG